MSAFHKNALQTGHRLAEYAIESVLGHGGFGITYLARDMTLGAQVAIKEYLPHEIASRDQETAILPNATRNAIHDYHAGLKNFVKEARALARFKHPNIVRVLRFFEANSTAYMVMEYEQGTSLADYLSKRGQKLDEPELLRIFLPVLNGLHAVHGNGLLHLDIKPENIYLRGSGDPMLIDFGSARQAISGSGHLQRVALTHGYAPMEQYPDKGKPGPATDIYGIGASMYRCISGKHPEDALERYQDILKYKTDPLTPAVTVGKRHYRQQILECVDWAMQIYPKDRPQSAREMQDGLMGKNRPVRQSASQPVSVDRIPTNAPRRKHFGAAASTPRRERDANTAALAWMAAGLMTASLAVATVIYWGDIKVYWQPPEIITRTPPPSPPPQVEVPAPVVAPLVEQPAATPEVKRAKTARAEAKTAHTPPAAARPRSAFALPATEALTLTGHQDWVLAVAVALDGKWLASAGNDKTIKLWETDSGKLLGSLRHGYAVNGVAISSDGAWIASAGEDGSVKLWDGKTGAPGGSLSEDKYALFTTAFSPNGKLLAAAGKGRSVYLWQADDHKRLQTLEGSGGDVYALAFSPDGKFLAAAGADKIIRIWNVKSGEAALLLSGHKEKILALAFSPDGKWLASGDAGQSIRVWEAASGTHARTLLDNPSILALAFSPDSRLLAAGLADKTVRLFNINDGSVSQTLSGHNDFVSAVAFSVDGKMFASGSRDKTVKIWKSK